MTNFFFNNKSSLDGPLAGKPLGMDDPPNGRCTSRNCICTLKNKSDLQLTKDNCRQKHVHEPVNYLKLQVILKQN